MPGTFNNLHSIAIRPVANPLPFQPSVHSQGWSDPQIWSEHLPTMFPGEGRRYWIRQGTSDELNESLALFSNIRAAPLKHSIPAKSFCRVGNGREMVDQHGMEFRDG